MNNTTPADDNHPHSPYGASGSATWRNCPGSVDAIHHAKRRGDIPERQESEAAKAGTRAHDYAEKVLRGMTNIEQVPEDIRDNVKEYTDFCNQLLLSSSRGCFTSFFTHGVEQVIPLFYYKKDVSTVDFWAISHDKTLHVVDYKNGFLPVAAENNSQGLIYAGSVYKHLGRPDLVERVAITIVQPNKLGYDGPDTWVISVDELLHHMKLIDIDYREALFTDGSPDTLNPGDKQCQWCDLKHVCTVRGKTSFGGVPPLIDPFNEFDNLEEATSDELSEIKATLTPEQIATICQHGDKIKSFVDDVMSGERQRIESGGEVRGMKLIPGRKGKRQWKDESKAIEYLQRKINRTDIYTKKLLSPAQAEKKIGKMSESVKKRFAEMVDQPNTKDKMVSVDHPTPAKQFGSVADDFEEIE
jgi:hypothetical protein